MRIRAGAAALAGMAACALLWTAACAPGPSSRPASRPVQLSPCGRAFVFVDHGRPAARIEIPETAGAVERRAAEILRSSILKMTGVDLPVLAAGEPGQPGVAAIGFLPKDLPPVFASSLSSLRPDGFLAGTSTGNLYIVSGGGKGAIYGVVHLLEKYFGCRRYSPTAEVFPPRDDLALGCLFEADNPVNEVRVVNGEFALDADYLDWMRLHDHRGLYGTGYYVHTFQRLVPWQSYFAAHPEYFALMNGKRIIDQPCLSRPEVFDIAVARLREEMASQPDKKIWSVSQNDNFSYCQCPECLAAIEEEGSPAGPVLRFVNRVAALFPDKTISTLAYQYSRPAPRMTRPAPNVEVMLCTIELNRSLSIAGDPSSASFVRDIEAWSRICGNLYLWDYTVNFSHHVSPFPNLHVLQPNIRFFVDHGVRRHFQQTNTGPGHETSELKAYLLARLLWNPGADVEAVTEDFLDGYYGKSGTFIGRYIKALEAALRRSGAKLDIYEPPAVHDGDHLSAGDIASYNALFDRAEAAAAGDPATLTRVRTARLPLMYAMLEIGKNDMFGPRGFYEEKGGRFVAEPRMADLIDDFFERCRDGGVRTLNESGLTPETYRDGVKRFIDVQVEGNLAFRKPVAADPPPAPKYAGGDPAVLTNGVRGASDFKVHWLGWEGVDITLVLDLGRPAAAREIALSTLSDQRSWILHPASVACSVSSDGLSFREIGTKTLTGDHQGEDSVRSFSWTEDMAGEGSFGPVRFVRFRIEGTKRLPDWHPSAGGRSWVFVDEIVIR
ncbi:MAG: DUF4838 domain-containing protein [Candidatus Aminicenantes bacterium]|nr:MAG: DUF4838 domain-containing protein [Candidatus Aminicenantes bacterium]